MAPANLTTPPLCHQSWTVPPHYTLDGATSQSLCKKELAGFGDKIGGEMPMIWLQFACVAKGKVPWLDILIG